MASVGGFFRGTSATSDFRFTDSEKKLIKSTTFPENFNEKLDITKVNLDIVKTWIGKEINDLMGYDDEVLIDMIYNMLSLDEKVDPKHIQITLTPFLDKNAPSFTQHLWNLLLSAQKDPMGIPKEFIDQRMLEIQEQKKKEVDTQEKIQEALGKAKAEIQKIVDRDISKPILLRKRRSRSRSYSRSHSRSRSNSRRYRSSRNNRSRRSRSRSGDRRRRYHRSRSSSSRSRSRSPRR